MRIIIALVFCTLLTGCGFVPGMDAMVCLLTNSCRWM